MSGCLQPPVTGDLMPFSGLCSMHMHTELKICLQKNPENSNTHQKNLKNVKKDFTYIHGDSSIYCRTCLSSWSVDFWLD